MCTTKQQQHLKELMDQDGYELLIEDSKRKEVYISKNDEIRKVTYDDNGNVTNNIGVSKKAFHLAADEFRRILQKDIKSGS